MHVICHQLPGIVELQVMLKECNGGLDHVSQHLVLGSCNLTRSSSNMRLCSTTDIVLLLSIDIVLRRRNRAWFVDGQNTIQAQAINMNEDIGVPRTYSKA